jgi:acylglycerol lipase
MKNNGFGGSITLIAPEIIEHSVRDGYPLMARVWRNENAPARIILIHGIVSHSGWYLRSCQYLADQGLEVHALDRRGSGLSFRGRGDVRDAQQWLDDFDDYTSCLSSTVPTVLLGISWGGKLAATLASRRMMGAPAGTTPLAGVGLICPGIYAYQQVSWAKQCLVRTAVAMGLGNRQVTIPLGDPALFTNNPFYKDYIRDDPFTLRRITLRFAVADLTLNRLARASAENIQVPSFLMLSGQERIVDNQRTRAFWDRVGARHKRTIEYASAAHTLEFEDNPDPYVQDLYASVMNLCAVR